ncbi:hypothetical protein LXL04_034145 [Taraxacum kok-saghyz]
MFQGYHKLNSYLAKLNQSSSPHISPPFPCISSYMKLNHHPEIEKVEKVYVVYMGGNDIDDPDEISMKNHQMLKCRNFRQATSLNPDIQGNNLSNLVDLPLYNRVSNNTSSSCIRSLVTPTSIGSSKLRRSGSSGILGGTPFGLRHYTNVSRLDIFQTQLRGYKNKRISHVCCGSSLPNRTEGKMRADHCPQGRRKSSKPTGKL